MVINSTNCVERITQSPLRKCMLHCWRMLFSLHVWQNMQQPLMISFAILLVVISLLQGSVFFDPLHSHLPVGIQRFTLPRCRRPSKYLKANILANNIFSFLSCIFLVCILFPCFIGIDKHVYSWKSSLSQLRRINLIYFRFCTEFDTRLFFYPILINPFRDYTMSRN